MDAVSPRFGAAVVCAREVLISHCDALERMQLRLGDEVSALRLKLAVK
jgi:hypothetical protein